jgi:hypothetical protein
MKLRTYVQIFEQQSSLLSKIIIHTLYKGGEISESNFKHEKKKYGAKFQMFKKWKVDGSDNVHLFEDETKLKIRSEITPSLLFT